MTAMISALRNRSLWVLTLLVLAALFSAPYYASSYILLVLISILSYICLAESWNVMGGFTGYFFFGSAAFYGIGAYITAIFPTVPYLLSVLLGGVVCAVVGFLVGVPFLRIRGPYFAIATYTLGELIKNIVYYVEHEFMRTTGRFIQTQSITTVYLTLVVITTVTLLTCNYIRRSKLGYALFSIRDDEEAAEASGVNTKLYKYMAFSITGFFSGATGACVVARFGYIDAWGAFDPLISFYTAVMGLIGGPGSIAGPALGASTLRILFEIFFGTGNPYPFGVILGAMLILTVMVFPSGIEGILKSLIKSTRHHPA